ncbi:unnamed protein product [Darwinula stevensoni]|uniref:Eukaryotic translation initiation factor 3 subunit K n=1 Tax=Darwinula stevensoni TaxID=69355 RepID=A0A7R9A677_9CRUS|nr:unnamed protein product [Darwinula stevensoni]CAG0896109.1 unnamed protein product [Darwinula stevensoni]
MADTMRETVSAMLKGIDRYNPENRETLELYIELQARDNEYDLEANLAVLKLYQFNPEFYKTQITALILLKALTNLPHTDFVLCKCLLAQEHLQENTILRIMYMADLLEMCRFKEFWEKIQESPDLVMGITGFEDSIRRFICHVINITFQRIEKTKLVDLLGGVSELMLKEWSDKHGWRDNGDGFMFIANQEENVKTKNITEKIDFESVAGIMAACR